jgi:hypothetical protein
MNSFTSRKLLIGDPPPSISGVPPVLRANITDPIAKQLPTRHQCEQDCGGTTPPCCYYVDSTNVEGTTSRRCARYRSRGGALDIALGAGLSRV